MDEWRLLGRYLASGLFAIGGLEWLLGRVVSRLAAAPPISGVARTVIEALGRAGFFLLSTAFLLALSLLLLAALFHGARAYRQRSAPELALAFLIAIFGAFCAAATVLGLVAAGSPPWLIITLNAMTLALAIWLLARAVLYRGGPTWALAGAGLVAAAYSAWCITVVAGASNSSSPTGVLQAGELAAALSPVAFFAAIAVPGRRWANRARWIAPLLAALLFAAANIADIITDQGFTGVFSIWSVGFTLYLPWPLYAVALALYLYSVLTCFSKGEGAKGFAGREVGLGLLLLLYAGFYLQLTYQHVLAVLALALITGVARPMFRSREPVAAHEVTT